MTKASASTTLVQVLLPSIILLEDDAKERIEQAKEVLLPSIILLEDD